MNTSSDIEARQANWIPLPGERLGSGEKGPVVEENDLFSKGEVESFYRRQGTGVVRTSGGMVLTFNLSELNLVGPKNKPSYITSGGRVGFDFSHTSHGLRITRLKIY